MKNLYQIINEYLYFGYLIPDDYPSEINISDVGNQFHSYDQKEVSSLFENVFEQMFSDWSGNGKLIIPISGGWDSRLLLGAALKGYNSERIKTFTFGCPRQYDFEIGNMIAKKYNTKHKSYNLFEVEFDEYLITEYIQNSGWTYFPDYFFNRYCLNNIAEPGDIVLSGFMGDPQTGGHFIYGNDKHTQLSLFVKNQNFGKGFLLHSPDYKPKDSIPEFPSDSIFNVHELLDFGIRQRNCIYPIICPDSYWKGWNNSGLLYFDKSHNVSYYSPFVNKTWAMYWGTVPNRLKEHQAFYLNMCKFDYPELFNLPSKKYLGRNKRDLHYFKRRIISKGISYVKSGINLDSTNRRMLNYMDYHIAFQRKHSYRSIIDKAVEYLIDNKVLPWMNINNYMKDKRIKYSSDGRFLNLIVGLYLNLRKVLVK